MIRANHSRQWANKCKDQRTMLAGGKARSPVVVGMVEAKGGLGPGGLWCYSKDLDYYYFFLWEGKPLESFEQEKRTIWPTTLKGVLIYGIHMLSVKWVEDTKNVGQTGENEGMRGRETHLFCSSSCINPSKEVQRSENCHAFIYQRQNLLPKK